MSSEARFIFNVCMLVVLLAAMVATLLLAWLGGRPAERLGASLYGASFFGTMALEIFTGQSLPVVPELFLDTLVAFGFLVLSIYYNNLWLGAAMMIKGLQLGMHATHLTDVTDPIFDGLNMYAVGLNFVSLMILLTIMGGTIATMRARRASRRSQPIAPGGAQTA